MLSFEVEPGRIAKRGKRLRMRKGKVSSEVTICVCCADTTVVDEGASVVPEVVVEGRGDECDDVAWMDVAVEEIEGVQEEEIVEDTRQNGLEMEVGAVIVV